MKTILDHKVDTREGKTVSQLIKEFQEAYTAYNKNKQVGYKFTYDEIGQKLEAIGLRVMLDDKDVSLHIGDNDNLKKLIKASNFHSDYRKTLKNHKDIKNKSKVIKKLYSGNLSRGPQIHIYNIDEVNKLLEIDRRKKDKEITPSTRITERRDDFDENLIIREVVEDGHQGNLYKDSSPPS